MARTLSQSRQRPAFETQLKLLKRRISAFSLGDWDEAISSATIIRVLVYDTGNSTSLFKHMGIKDDFRVWSSSEGVNPHNILSTESLTLIRSENGNVGKQPLDLDLIKLVGRKLDLNSWWNMPVIKDSAGSVWTRGRLVIELGHKAGGAHYEDFEDQELSLLKGDTFGWQFNSNGRAVPLNISPWRPSVQTIAIELALSMEQWLEENPA